MITYFILLCVILVIVAKIYISIKFSFWSKQPVFHLYDFHYYLYKPQVIQNNLPNINKYCDFKNIITYDEKHLTDDMKQQCVDFISNHYLKNKISTYVPTKESFFPYLENNKYQSFISIFYSNPVMDDREIVSIMTSKSLTMTNGKNKFYVYYVDNLCVDKKFRKSGIAPKMIQTHEYNQRHHNKNIQVSLFKREGELTGIVPLVVYDTFLFSKISPSYLSTMYKIKHETDNYDKIYNFITNMKNKFECIIEPHLSNLLTLIKNKNIYIYSLSQNVTIMALYYFRNTYTTYNGNNMMECFASISNCSDEQLFYKGFTQAYVDMTNKLKTKHLLIENISHNHKLIDRIYDEYEFKSPTAFFLYNYIQQPINHNNCFIIY